MRARSFEAFVSPPLLPPENISEPHYAAACHRFGWLDGVAVSERRQLPSQTDDLASISILIRAESDDPWSSNMHTVDLYTLDPDPTYTESRSDTPSSRGSSESPVEAPPAASRDRSPYLFPPAHVASFPSAQRWQLSPQMPGEYLLHFHGGVAKADRRYIFVEAPALRETLRYRRREGLRIADL